MERGVESKEFQTTLAGSFVEHEYFRTGRVSYQNVQLDRFSTVVFDHTCLSELPNCCSEAGSDSFRFYDRDDAQEGAPIGELIDLSGCQIEGDVNLFNIAVKEVRLAGATIRGHLELHLAKITTLDLRGAHLEGELMIRGGDLTYLHLEDVQLGLLGCDECDYSNLRIWCSAHMAPIIRAVFPQALIRVSFQPGKYSNFADED